MGQRQIASKRVAKILEESDRRSHKGRGSINLEAPDDFFDKQISEAIFGKDEISFDWLEDGELVETTKLTSLNGVDYAGRAMIYAGTKKQRVAEVDAVLYSNAKGFILVGRWIYKDDGEENTCIVQFFDGKKVKK